MSVFNLDPGEYPPYFKRYIDRVSQRDFPEVLEENTRYVLEVLRSISPAQSDFRYEPSKWSVKQLVQHINDTERVLSYRLLVALRGDAESLLPSYDENAFAENSQLVNRSWDSIIEEFEWLRLSLRKLTEGVPEMLWQNRINTPAGSCSARALVIIIIGHTLHHLMVMKEKYTIEIKPGSMGLI